MIAPETVLIFDTETTGLDPKRDLVIEAAGALWSVKHRTVFASFSWLVQANENPAERINRIPTPALALGIRREEELPHELSIWFGRADAVIAHYADFDRGFMPSFLQNAKPWICSKNDIEWPRAGMGKGLRDLAADHDVGIVRAHRAMADVDILVRLLERCAELGSDVGQMLARAMRPKARYVADVPREMNDLVKQHGFRWVDRAWTRTLAIEDAAKLPFPVRRTSEAA